MAHTSSLAASFILKHKLAQVSNYSSPSRNMASTHRDQKSTVILHCCKEHLPQASSVLQFTCTQALLSVHMLHTYRLPYENIQGNSSADYGSSDRHTLFSTLESSRSPPCPESRALSPAPEADRITLERRARRSHLPEGSGTWLKGPRALLEYSRHSRIDSALTKTMSQTPNLSTVLASTGSLDSSRSRR